jgi:hypothetical protein
MNKMTSEPNQSGVKNPQMRFTSFLQNTKKSTIAIIETRVRLVPTSAKNRSRSMIAMIATGIA